MKTEFVNIPDDKKHANLKAKLSNSLSDLKFYRIRIEKIQGNLQFKTGALASLRGWESKILRASPVNGDALFYECWQFVHDFDAQLKIIEHGNP